ncbi:hypothetical protein DXT96_02185 [Agrobacterium sp. ICMP 6402]|nr:hypothetical protein [Agrobacterium sp. ICMP 6402]
MECAGTPLCPAGHLPLKGGDRQAARYRPSHTLRIRQKSASCRSPSLWGRCPAGQRGVKPRIPTETSPSHQPITSKP